MTRFASVQAAVAQPFFAAAPLPLTKLEQMAEQAGLPGALVSEPKGVIALRAAEKFMVQLDRRIKHPTYFLETLQNPYTSRTASVANIDLPRSLTGLEAVYAVAQHISSILHGARFFVEVQGERIWLLRTAGTTDYTDFWPVQQYNIEVALQSVRQVIGYAISPCALRLTRFVPRTSLPETWRDLPVELCRNGIGLAFALDDLVPERGHVVINRPASTPIDGQRRSEVPELRECLETFLGCTATECLSVRVAGAFGMSSRSYRRHLQQLGVNHSQLAADARLHKAQKLLADPSIPITEIAFELGYIHSSAFTRFFKQRTCRTPQEFRLKSMT